MPKNKIPSIDELEKMLKEMASQHPGQKDKHIPQIQSEHLKQKVIVTKAAPQKKMRKGTQKGQ
jgi:hypothetical protein